MQIKLTVNELRDLAQTAYVQIGWMVDLPTRGGRVFVPMHMDPQKVGIEAGEPFGNIVACYVKADEA